MRSARVLVGIAVSACASPVVVEKPAPPPPSRAIDASPVPPPAGVSEQLLSAVKERERAQAEAAIACATGKGCAAVAPPLAVDDGELTRALATRARGGDAGRVQAAIARAVLEGALAADAQLRSNARRSITFADRGAVFALDDALVLLSASPRPRRAALLASLVPALEKRAAIRARERELVEQAARAIGMTRGDLLARRIGLDEIALRELANGALAGTAALLGPVATDVTLLPDARAPVSNAKAKDDGASFSLCVPGRTPILKRDALVGPVKAACEAAHKDVVDPSLVYAFAVAGRYAQPQHSDDGRVIARDIAIELRRAALGTLALLDGASVAGEDALASRILDDGAEPLAGASIFLDVDEAGAVLDRLAGALQAAHVLQSRWRNEPQNELLARLESAPPLDEQGFPEAFVEVAKLLPESIR